MKQVHITLQGKGGIGKSYISSLVAQHLLEKSENLICFDTDPVNATLCSFKALNARPVNLIFDGRIKASAFDEMFEVILQEDSHFVIDNGASSFVPLSDYLIQHEVLQAIAAAGKQPIIHIVIAGGLALANTVSDFNQLLEQMPAEARITLWLNEHFGKVHHNGKPFEEAKAYQKHKDRIHSMIRLPRLNEDTFGQTIEQLVEERLTFKEALDSATFRIMSKQRITIYRRNLYQQLAVLN